MEYIAFDAHKHYTLALVEREDGRTVRERRIPHERGTLRQFLRGCERGSPVAVETIGNWYWIVDEIEAAGCVPKLVHARKAKLMMGLINKTDKLDARGLNRLQRTGTLPTVWIPPGELRDQRDLPRTRMVLVRQRTQLKNRIHATLAKYALTVTEVSDLFGRQGRELLGQRLPKLPPQTAFATERLVEQLEALDQQVDRFEERTGELFEVTPEIELVMTLPGVGFILGVVIVLEVGDITRFATNEKFAAYAGTTPRVHASGGKVRYGRLRPDVNRYLKWAFVEAANSICLNRWRWPHRHVSRLYERVARRKGHQKAIGAVARHLAEATYWMLSKREPYREPEGAQPRHAKPRLVHGGVSAGNA
ncbi:MAG: IS110 family transposase [Candidatus Methylomirabilia bacterium]